MIIATHSRPLRNPIPAWAAHQYNFDSETTLGFLERFDLIDDFALNLEANHGTLAGHSGEHEVEVAHSRGKLGSIDANRNEMLLGAASAPSRT